MQSYSLLYRFWLVRNLSLKIAQNRNIIIELCLQKEQEAMVKHLKSMCPPPSLPPSLPLPE